MFDCLFRDLSSAYMCWDFIAVRSERALAYSVVKARSHCVCAEQRAASVRRMFKCDVKSRAELIASSCCLDDACVFSPHELDVPIVDFRATTIVCGPLLGHRPI